MSNKIAVGLLLLMSSQFSFATVFEYVDLNANNGGPLGDKLNSVKGTYNDANQHFTWDTTFNTSNVVDGFWLVVNNGPNPKTSDVNELAIMYGDMTTGNGTGILKTYAYNGQNNANSWANPGILLQTDTFSYDADSFSIAIDASAINGWNDPPDTSPDYTGISFDDKVGVWFHITKGSDFGYDGDPLTADTKISEYIYRKQGWYDKTDKDTTTVPEPATLLLLGLGLLGLGFRGIDSRLVRHR